MELGFQVTNEVLTTEENCGMKTNRVVALAAILCVALVCLAPTSMAGDMDGVIMKDGQMMLIDGKIMDGGKARGMANQ
jgi:hypothetical protein